MNYDLEQRGNAWIIRFDGDLGATDDPELRKAFVSLSGEAETNLVADMSKVTFLDSVILGTLLWGMKNMRERGGDLRLADLTSFVKRLFATTALDQAFKTFETTNEAAASFDA